MSRLSRALAREKRVRKIKPAPCAFCNRVRKAITSAVSLIRKR